MINDIRIIFLRDKSDDHMDFSSPSIEYYNAGKIMQQILLRYGMIREKNLLINAFHRKLLDKNG